MGENMKTLIIADIQYDFLPGGTLAVPRGDEIIPVINKLTEYFDLVVATQDWHPADHASFASNHPGKRPYDRIELGGIEQVLWPDQCVQGTRGAELSAAFDTRKAEAIFRKGMDPEIDSYSAFFDNLHQKSTGLGDYLKGKKAGKVYVVGLAGDYCVLHTVMDALMLGFKAGFIKDATRSISDAGFEEALRAMREKGAEMVSSSDFVLKPAD
jgi:nicotinamidase/pyrazinamidase